MELLTCPNCLGLYGDVQEACPTCGADAQGTGGRPSFDGTTRSAIRHLGGLFGGILPGPGSGEHVLWCSRGVALVAETDGLAWRARTTGTVTDVRVETDAIVVAVGGREAVLDATDGSERA